MDWPPQSPDLNPIENLWHIVKQQVFQAKPTSLSDLDQIVQKYWNDISPLMCQRLIASMPRRIAACIAAEGGSTKY
jgi:DDE superfamily endonuclease